MNTKKVGLQLKQARKRLGLSQLEVARAAQISRASIIALEKGRTIARYDKMVRLEKVLQLSK